MPLFRFTILLAPALMLAACSEEPEIAEGSDGRSASGEVLEGTISDEMLALDKVRSQAPLLQAVESAAGDGTAAMPAEGEAVEPASDDAPAPAEPTETFDEAFSAED